MIAQRDFDPDPESPAAVRAFVCEFADVELAHPAVLVASELATNAVKHAQTRFTVTVDVDRSIRLTVEDSSPRLPRIDSSPNGSRDGGRGLFIVKAVSSRWGVDPTPTGKQVWAEVDTASSLDRT